MPYIIWLLIFGKYLCKDNNGRALSMLFILWIVAISSMPVYEGWSVFNTTWWYIVSITTVGYGDMYPNTVMGKMYALPIMIIGIGTAAFLIGNIAASLFTALINLRRTKMKGLGNYSSYKNHIVLMGWRGNFTLDILNQIFSDLGRKERNIVLCSESLKERPDTLPKEVVFVKGDIGSEDVLHRAGVTTADKIIITGRDDQETCLAALAVVTADDHDKAHITVKIDNPDNAKHIERLEKFHGDISIIRSLSSNLITQEMQDRGIGEVIAELLDNNGHATPYRVDLKGPVKWERAIYEINYDRVPAVLPFAGITPEGKRVINPSWDVIVSAIFVIANKRPE